MTKQAFATVKGNKIIVQADFIFKDDLKDIPGARWEASTKSWSYPKSVAAVEALMNLFGDSRMEYDDAFHALIEQAVEAKLARFKKTATDLPPIPVTKFPAWRHQLQAYHFAFNLDGAMLAMDMGTGKTKVATDLIVNRGHKRTLVLCPKSAIEDVWVKQIPIHAGSSVLVVDLGEGPVATKTKVAKMELEFAQRRNLPVVVVINYDSAWRDPFASWALKEADFDLVICDESHKIKSPGGKASQFAHKIGPGRGAKRIALTGTPMPHSPLDAFAQYRFVDPAIFGTNFTKFRSRYAIMGGYGNHQVLKYQNQDELNEKFYNVAYRVGKEILDLPPFQHITRTTKLTSASQKIYNDIEKELCAFIGVDQGDGLEKAIEEIMSGKGAVTADNALTNLLRLQQVANGFVLDDEKNVHEIGKEKPDLLEDVLDDLDTREPVVVFCRFRYDLEIVRMTAAKQGRRYAELSGVHNNLKAWQAGDADVLGVQIQSGGAGIDLTRSRYAIYYSLGFSMGDYDQSLARVHRPGQDKSVTYIHLLTAGTVDEKVYKVLDKRRKDVSKALEERGETTE